MPEPATRSAAEALFESRTVAEIREIEARTRKDIEAKKQQLRQLVGDSHRDLIDSADKIVGIATNCELILQGVKDIQHGFSFLAHSFATADSLLNEKRDSLSRHEVLFAVSGRVRYLVDTPEVIWGYLDGQQCLHAVQRYLRAKMVHTMLPNTFAKDLLAKFPLLKHQWPVIGKFETQIGTVALDSLSSPSCLSYERTADALAALVALRGLDASAALAQLLDARKAAFVALLQSGSRVAERQGEAGTSVGAAQGQGADKAAENKGMDPVSAVLAEAAGVVQATVAQVGGLFLSGQSSTNALHELGRRSGATEVGPTRSTGTGSSGAADSTTSGGAAGAVASGASTPQGGWCALQALVGEDEVEVSELQFAGHTALVAAQGSQGAADAPELAAWRTTTTGLQAKLLAPPVTTVERAVSVWIKELAHEAATHGAGLLGACTTARALVDAEWALRAAIDAWRRTEQLPPGFLAPATAAGSAHAPTPRPRPGLAPALSTAISSSLSVRHSVRPSGADGHGGSHGTATWEAVCARVLGTPLKLWQDVFYPLFLTRAKQLLADGFAAVVASLPPALDTYLTAAAAAPPQPAGQVACAVWPHVAASGGAQLARVGSSDAGGGSDGLGSAASLGLLTATAAGSLSDPGQASRVPWSERLAAGGLGSGGKARTAADDHGFRRAVHVLCARVDTQLLAVLHAALLLLSSEPPPSSAPPANASSGATHSALHATRPSGASGGLASAASVRAGGLGGARDAARAAELEPYIQARCVDMARELSTLLREKVAGLGTPGAGPAGAGTAEQALLVGRLCSALAWDSQYLGVLLGPSDAWRAAVAAAAGPASRRPLTPGGLGGARAGAKALAAGSKMQSVMAQLRGTAVTAYRLWAQWAAGCLVSSLRASYLSDDTLCSPGVPRNWQETVIPASSTPEAPLDAASLDDAPMTDMRFWLPACPSAGMQALLYGACSEVRRAGDHTAPPEALQVLEWELLSGCVGGLAGLLTPEDLMLLDPSHHNGHHNVHLDSNPSAASGGDGEDSARPGVSAGRRGLLPGLGAGLTDKGVLQLLFDVRLARDLLAGGRPLARAQVGLRPGAGAAGGDTVRLGASAGPLSPGAAGPEQEGSLLLDPSEPAAVAAVAGLRKQGTQLELTLQDRLDPIDWATYEKHLWAAVRRHVARSAVLYGILTQISRTAPSDASGGRAGTPATGSGASITPAGALNVLGVLPVAHRFPYLPIAVPHAASGGLTSAKSRIMSSAKSLSKLAPGGESSSDLAGQYSFASLGANPTRLGTAGAAAAAAAATAGMAGGAGGSGLGASASNAFGALQARLGTTGALGSLGSLLGDKAAEMTALAQQRFDLGNLSDLGNALGSAGTGLFSSLTKGVAKR